MEERLSAVYELPAVYMGIRLEQLAVSYTTLAEHRTARSGVLSSEEISFKQENGLQTRGKISGKRLHCKRE